jgi:hypothetical protein
MHLSYFPCHRCRLHYPISDLGEIYLFWEELLGRQPMIGGFVPSDFVMMMDSQRGYPTDVFYGGIFLTRHIDAIHLWVPERTFQPARGWYVREGVTDRLGVAMPE